MGPIAMGHQSISGRKDHETYLTLIRKVHVLWVNMIVQFVLLQVGEVAAREGAAVLFLFQIMENESFNLDTVWVVLERTKSLKVYKFIEWNFYGSMKYGSSMYCWFWIFCHRTHKYFQFPQHEFQHAV